MTFNFEQEEIPQLECLNDQFVTTKSITFYLTPTQLQKRTKNWKLTSIWSGYWILKTLSLLTRHFLLRNDVIKQDSFLNVNVEKKAYYLS